MTVSDLADTRRFRLLDQITHQELPPFIFEYYFTRKTWLVWFHYAISIGSFLAWIAAGIADRVRWTQWLAVFGWAVLSFALVVPIHEGIHGIAYKLFGARDVRFSGSLRQLYAYAAAHRFVADRRTVIWVALAPFLILNSLFLGVAFFSPSLRFFSLALLLIHIGGTSGDWAVLNYYWVHRGREIFTYDDVDEGKSYFFERTKHREP